ncbi:DUF120 domain-containing protein [Methanothermococcus sp. SCGC AD-155-C09]|nr:DUF120 domain-containing protein [Methanothermococcus sp. SCGC AD-155-C09]
MTNKLFGQVISGKGEGKYYMSLKPYKERFYNILGYYPFEGTLNIKKLNNNFKLDKLNWLEIDDFKYNGKEYYGVKILPVKIYGKIGYWVNGAMIRPKKSIHDENIIEVISKVNLRKFLFLKNNDIVIVNV